MSDLGRKIEESIKIIKMGANEAITEVCYSGGKDSEVILALAKMSGINFKAIYKNTTIDPPGTIKHCKDKGVEINAPKAKFFKLVEKKGFPSRRARFCCDYLKEYKIFDNAIQGIRRSESVKRAKMYKESDPIICRTYSAKEHVNVILPILGWKDCDVEQFINHYAIKCHPLYYDENGKFQVLRRLGCIGCPLQGDNGKADFVMYPKMLKKMIKSAQIWWDTHPNANSHKKFENVYDLCANNLFYKSYYEWYLGTYGLFGKRDWKPYLEDYFHIDL